MSAPTRDNPSAWDITGAIAYSALAAWFWVSFWAMPSTAAFAELFLMVFAIVATSGAIYCILRCFGVRR